MDGCPKAGIPEFAYGKAYSAVTMQTSSRNFRDTYTTSGDPRQMNTMNAMVDNTGGRMNPAPGGVVMKSDG